MEEPAIMKGLCIWIASILYVCGLESRSEMLQMLHLFEQVTFVSDC